MPFDSGTISFSVFKLSKEIPEDHLDRFAKYSVCKLEEVGDAPNLGWCGRHLLERRIDSETAYVGEFLHMHFRSAVRKIPPSLMKAECMQRELAQMQADKISNLSRKRKKEIKEEVEEELLKYMPPQLSGIPFVYFQPENLLFVGSGAVKPSDSLITLFMESMDIEAVPRIPVGEAMRVLDTRQIQIDPLDFTGKNLSEMDSLLLGRDFLTWIWYKCESDTPKFIVPDLGEFSVGIDGPLTLVSESIGSHETVLRKGLPTLSPEAHSGIQAGKKLKSARVSITRGDDIWSFTVDADNFIFKSMKLPDGEAMDAIARFEERIEFIYMVQEAFFSLYSDFIKLFAGKDRKIHEKDIQDWTTNRLYHNPDNMNLG